MLKFIFAARDTGALPPYQYSKLATSESIRIIALHQAEAFNDPLHCTIITKDRPGLYKLTDNCLNYYEAISYAWGIPEFTKALICNGNSVSKITPNVDNMLRRLRKKHRVRYLWIDAISLNQADKEEKAQQVPLMSKIYNQAARVLIWLGDEKHCIKESFALIRSFALAQYDNVRIEELITSLPEDWHLILNSLLDRPWFRRRWILQEVAQSRNTTIQCHTEEIGWVWLVDAVSYLKSHTSIQNQPKLSSHSFHALDTVQNIQGKNTDWLDLLWNLDHAECSDPNDRLFALYGLAKSTPENLTPAIDCKIGWNINFTNFATKCAVNGRWFNLVQHVAAFGALSDLDGKGPSWVPNWAGPRRRILPPGGNKGESSRELEAIQEDGGIRLILLPKSTGTTKRNYNVLTGVFAPSTSSWKWQELLDWWYSQDCSGNRSDAEYRLVALFQFGTPFFLREDVLTEVTRIRLRAEHKLSEHDQEYMLRLARYLLKENFLFMYYEELEEKLIGLYGERRKPRQKIGICSGIVKPGDGLTRIGNLSYVIRLVEEDAKDVATTVPYCTKNLLGLDDLTNDEQTDRNHVQLVGFAYSEEAQSSWNFSRKREQIKPPQNPYKQKINVIC